MKKIIIISFFLTINLFGYGQEKALIMSANQMENLFKSTIDDFGIVDKPNRKLKRKQKKYKNLGEVIEIIKPQVYDKYMKDKRLKNSFQGHEYHGFWIVKSLSYKGEKGDVLVIIDNETGEILLITQTNIVNQIE